MSLNSHSKSSDLVLPPTVLSVLLASKQCPQTVANSVHDRAYGALFGFVIGDCIGGHLIHRSSQADKVISAMLMCKNQTFNLNPGEGTDET